MRSRLERGAPGETADWKSSLEIDLPRRSKPCPHGPPRWRIPVPCDPPMYSGCRPGGGGRIQFERVSRAVAGRGNARRGRQRGTKNHTHQPGRLEAAYGESCGELSSSKPLVQPVRNGSGSHPVPRRWPCCPERSAEISVEESNAPCGDNFIRKPVDRSAGGCRSNPPIPENRSIAWFPPHRHCPPGPLRFPAPARRSFRRLPRNTAAYRHRGSVSRRTQPPGCRWPRSMPSPAGTRTHSATAARRESWENPWTPRSRSGTRSRSNPRRWRRPRPASNHPSRLSRPACLRRDRSGGERRVHGRGLRLSALEVTGKSFE